MDYTPQHDLSDKERLVAIEQILGRMEQRLFGNGQPGELSTIKKRLTTLEQYKWQISAIFTALIGLVEFLVHRT